MEQIINAACLNGCGLAQNQQHGCYLRDQFKVIRIILLSVIVMTLHVYASDGAIERSSIGEITDFSGNAQIVHSSANNNDGMQVGGKVFPSDIIRTNSGNVEIVFGINSRLFLAGNTEISVDSLIQRSKIKSNLEYSTSNYKLTLKSGLIRVRVRENFITSTVITIIAGDIQVVAPRSDIVISRDIKNQAATFIGVLVSWGRALVNKKNVNDAEWNINNEKEITAGFNSLIQEKDLDDESVKWDNIGVDRAREAANELPFSVDKNTTGFDDIPERSPDLQGA